MHDTIERLIGYVIVAVIVWAVATGVVRGLGPGSYNCYDLDGPGFREGLTLSQMEDMPRSWQCFRH
jgi:hypothetical protein